MDINLTFFGAARNVTGSCFLVEANGVRLLVDCGLYQERDLRERNWADFPVPAQQLDAVLLTHAHLDHCGRIPKLVKEGFSGPIYATPATADIAAIVMQDSAHIQEEDIRYKKSRHEKENRTSPHPYEPLYTTKDAQRAATLFEHVRYREPVRIAEGIEAKFYEAGHILGSTCIILTVFQGGASRSILFSGDVGRWDLPIMRDPDPIENADYILMESTYGNRTHEPAEDIPARLESVINNTRKAGGHVVIPSFAVERTQELLYHLNGLLTAGRIPQTPVFLDSPMAIRVTEVFRRHPEMFDREALKQLKSGVHPCDFPGLKMSRSTAESKAINEIDRPCIIIAGSGMCTGGRIKHHLKHHISRPDNTILFIGYQAVGTLGREIVDGADQVRIHGRYRMVRANIERIGGFSAHADRRELMRWLQPIDKAPRRVFIIHGEEEAANAFAAQLQTEKGWRAEVPEYAQTVSLD